MFLILILVLIIIGLLIYSNSNKGFKGKIPKSIEISKTYGGAPSTEEYKINMRDKKIILKKWHFKKGTDEVNYSLSKKQVDDINKMFNTYNVTNYEKGEDGYNGGYDDKLIVKFSDGSKLKIHTYGGKQYLKGDNKKLFETLLEYVEKKFEGE